MRSVVPAMKRDRPLLPLVEILGVKVDLLTTDGLNSILERAVALDERVVIGYQNLHGVYLYHRDPRLREFCARSDYVHVDGMSLIAAARLLGHSVSRSQRVSYLDWLDPLMQCAESHGWSLFYVGAKPGVAKEAGLWLEKQYPGLRFFHHHGYFDATAGSAENRKVVKAIEAVRPQVLLVGMGMPRQEHWVLDHLDRLAANVVMTAGGFIEYVSGTIAAPPRWMGRIGLEWLFRLVSEPRRLAKRYLLEPWFLLPLLLNDLRRRQWRGGRQTNRDHP